jgi:ribosomal protein L11 methyltransferase
MYYIQLHVRCANDFSEILMAELAEIGFDTFEENQNGFHAYIEEAQMDFEGTKALLEQYAGLSPIHYGMQKIARENWNQTWESNYPPIVIGDQILVKTPFHTIKENFQIVLTIIPKMSFGTGHHATTSQMLSMLLAHPPTGAKVVDAGTGTGILAIMAEKLGAIEVLGFDNDPWCIENSQENYGLNNCTVCTSVLASSLAEFKLAPADAILANINKNVILKEIPDYAIGLKPGGQLFLSGFFTEDCPDIEKLALENGLTETDSMSHDNWACLLFTKSH